MSEEMKALREQLLRNDKNGYDTLDEAQLAALVAGIDCPTTVVYADPPQPYFPEPLRSRRASLLPDGQLHVIAGTHHLHMEDPARVAMLIGPFLRA